MMKSDINSFLIYSVIMFVVKGYINFDISSDTSKCSGLTLNMSCVVGNQTSGISIAKPNGLYATACTAPLGEHDIFCTSYGSYKTTVSKSGILTTVFLTISSLNKSEHNGIWRCHHGNENNSIRISVMSPLPTLVKYPVIATSPIYGGMVSNVTIHGHVYCQNTELTSELLYANQIGVYKVLEPQPIWSDVDVGNNGCDYGETNKTYTTTVTRIMPPLRGKTVTFKIRFNQTACDSSFTTTSSPGFFFPGFINLNVSSDTSRCSGSSLNMSCVVDNQSTGISISKPDGLYVAICTAPLGGMDTVCPSFGTYKTVVFKSGTLTTIVLTIPSLNKSEHNGIWRCEHGIAISSAGISVLSPLKTLVKLPEIATSPVNGGTTSNVTINGHVYCQNTDITCELLYADQKGVYKVVEPQPIWSDADVGNNSCDDGEKNITYSTTVTRTMSSLRGKTVTFKIRLNQTVCNSSFTTTSSPVFFFPGYINLNVSSGRCSGSSLNMSCVVDNQSTRISITNPDGLYVATCLAPLGGMDTVCISNGPYKTAVSKSGTLTTIILTIPSLNKSEHNGIWGCEHAYVTSSVLITVVSLLTAPVITTSPAYGGTVSNATINGHVYCQNTEITSELLYADEIGVNKVLEPQPLWSDVDVGNNGCDYGETNITYTTTVTRTMTALRGKTVTFKIRLNQTTCNSSLTTTSSPVFFFPGNPNPPIEVAVKCFGNFSANLTWTSGHNNGAIQTFFIRYKSNTNSVLSHAIKDPGQKRKATTELKNLKRSTSYTFEVIAVNKFGETKSNAVFCTTHSKLENIHLDGKITGSFFGGFVIALLITLAAVYIRKRTNQVKETVEDHEINDCNQSRYEELHFNTIVNTPETQGEYEDTRQLESDRAQYESIQYREDVST